MRRSQISIAVAQGVRDHFPPDVRRVFHCDNIAGFEPVAAVIQERVDPEQDWKVVTMIENLVADDVSDQELDALSDGEIADPHVWLLDKVKQAI